MNTKGKQNFERIWYIEAFIARTNQQSSYQEKRN